MPKAKQLTATAVESLKKAAPGKRVRLMDSKVTNFGVSVTDKGTKTYFLVARFPGSTSGPARREIGKASQMTLADARDRAIKWNVLIEAGKDPAKEEQREREAQITKDATTFGAMVEKFIAEKLPGERKGHDVELSIRKDLLPAWKSKPILDVTDADVENVIKEKKRSRWGTATSKKGKVYKRKIGGKVAARNLYALIQRIFNWAIGQAEYRRIGLKLSPCATIQKSFLLDESSAPRNRALSDRELTALWRASGKLDAPYSYLYRVLVLSALRKQEAAKAVRNEFDFDVGSWTIPATRMKGRNSGRKAARAHLVPLTPEIEELILSARQHGGDYIFSTTSGKRPSHLGAKVKIELDRLMLEELRAMVVERGEDPKKVKLERWTNHDIRRTCRTHLAQMKIEERVREAVLAHRPPGITGTYDVHEYENEKREALQMWANRLRSIVEPPPSNVIDLLTRTTELR
jgi:integrase